ncbi:MAG: hypothetical protein AB3N23_04515 [Paracoccaceae bacterium]
MTTTPALSIYLEPDLRQSAEAGQHNFIRLMVEVAEESGFQVAFRDTGQTQRLAARTRSDYALFHMESPVNERHLCFRRTYYYPFWAIEPTEKRWDWHVARTTFDPTDVPRKEADGFFARWQTRLFSDAPQKASSAGYVYIPLQGRLLDHRSFQSCSPLQMIENVLEHDHAREIVAALHPKAKYSTAELDKLDALARRFPRLRVETGDMERWLTGCDYVVTQNSSAAFSGYFFRKPAVLFAQIDFGHIANQVRSMGPEDAIQSAMDLRPDYAGYIHWFWQRMSINAGRPDAKDRIADAFRRNGWPVTRPARSD